MRGWNGSPPLLSGTAIRAGEIGTLGVACHVQTMNVLTTAWHVTGPVDLSTAIEVWAGSSWSQASVCRWQPSNSATMSAIDLGFVRSDSAVANRLDLPTYHRGFEFACGDPLFIAGGMGDSALPCTYDGPFASSAHKGAFDADSLADLDTARLGIIRLPTPYDPADYDGNSGGAIWGRLNDVYACQGLLIGVSESEPTGLIVRLRAAMAKLGIVDYEVL